jgi:hypothetical protein
MNSIDRREVFDVRDVVENLEIEEDRLQEYELDGGHLHSFEVLFYSIYGTD